MIWEKTICWFSVPTTGPKIKAKKVHKKNRTPIVKNRCPVMCWMYFFNTMHTLWEILHPLDGNAPLIRLSDDKSGKRIHTVTLLSYPQSEEEGTDACDNQSDERRKQMDIENTRVRNFLIQPEVFRFDSIAGS